MAEAPAEAVLVPVMVHDLRHLLRDLRRSAAGCRHGRALSRERGCSKGRDVVGEHDVGIEVHNGVHAGGSLSVDVADPEEGYRNR